MAGKSQYIKICRYQIDYIHILLSFELKDFCRENRHRYPVDFRLPLTVGPTEFVLAFFKESVLKRTYKKSISMETDVRTQIALRNDENENSELTLLESNMALCEKKASNILIHLFF